MSLHAIVTGAEIMRLKAFARACERIQGARLTLQPTGSYLFGSLALCDNTVVQSAGLRDYQATLRLQFVPHDGASTTTPIVTADGVLENGYLQISIDQDRLEVIESVIGKNASRLMDLYKCEVIIDTVKQVEGDNFEFSVAEQMVDGVPVHAVRAREKVQVLY